MARIKGRQARPAGASATLYARVAPHNMAKAQAAAGALGTSVAAYLDALLEHEELDVDGRPLWWEGQAPTSSDQEELPLQRVS